VAFLLTIPLHTRHNILMDHIASAERPRVRPGLIVAPDNETPGRFVLWDQLRISSQPQQLSAIELEILKRINGRHTPRDLHSAAIQSAGGLIFPFETVTDLLARLDSALYLDSPRFDGYLAGPVREPSCIGCYHGDPVKLREQLKGYFTMPGGPGPLGDPMPDGRLRAALLPHIDYARGNVTFAWGFKELFERTAAALFVIVATSHYSPHRFTLTRKNFKSPLGIVPTDQEYLDRLVKHYGDGLFDDPYAHYPEHSIELEVVYLQYLYENVRPIRIVPLVVGPFRDCVDSWTDPAERPDIQRMIQALRKAEEETPEPICYVISGDLAHIGPKFKDPDPVGEPLLTNSRNQDRALMECAEAADAAGYFRIVAQEGDARRICGLPPTYTLLQAIQPKSGKLLHYGQYVHPQGFESVSFASAVFDR
jgi:AmmeMemoRadiSam system protein B